MFSAEPLHRWKMHLGVVSRQQAGQLTQERSMTLLAPCPPSKLVLGSQTPLERALHHAAKHYQSELHVGQPLWFWRRGANAAKEPTSAFWHPGVVINITLATVWIAYRGSVVKCARSQVRPFHEDDEAAMNTSRRRTTTTRWRLFVRRHHWTR